MLFIDLCLLGLLDQRTFTPNFLLLEAVQAVAAGLVEAAAVRVVSFVLQAMELFQGQLMRLLLGPLRVGGQAEQEVYFLALIALLAQQYLELSQHMAEAVRTAHKPCQEWVSVGGLLAAVEPHHQELLASENAEYTAKEMPVVMAAQIIQIIALAVVAAVLAAQEPAIVRGHPAMAVLAKRHLHLAHL